MIDVKWLKKNVEQYIKSISDRPTLSAENQGLLNILNGTLFLIEDAEYLREQPVVVYCKDCRHATMTSDGKLCKYCELDTDDDGYPREVYNDAEWFCADGERR